MMIRLSVCVLALAALAPVASAQYGTVGYNFFGPAGSQTVTKPSAISLAPNMTFATVTNEPTVNMINTKQWTAQSAADLAVYYTFTLTTAQAVSLSNLQLNTTVSNVGPKNMELRSSRDNFATIVDTKTLTQNATTQLSYTLPAAQFGTIGAGQSVEFRLYGYNANNTARTASWVSRRRTAARTVCSSPWPPPCRNPV